MNTCNLPIILNKYKKEVPGKSQIFEERTLSDSLSFISIGNHALASTIRD